MSEANNPGAEEAPQELAPDANAEGGDHSTSETGEANTSEADEDDGQEPSEADDHEEIEYDGEKYLVPPKLKEALTQGVLRQSDYTQKTQTLAEQRRELEARQQAWEQERAQQAEAVRALREEHGKVATIEKELGEYRKVDWRAVQAQIAAIPDPTAKAQAIADYNLAWSGFATLEREFEQAKQSLSQKEQEFNQAQTQRVETALRDTLQTIAKSDPSFTLDKAQATIRHAMDNYGLTEAEARQMADPRVWKLLISDRTKAEEIAALKAENAKLKGQRTAQAANASAQQVKPAVRIAGKAPVSGISDDLSADEWVKRREAQVAKRRA